MLPMIDQLWVLMAFLAAIAGFFGLAALLTDLLMRAAANREERESSQAIRLAAPSWADSA